LVDPNYYDEVQQSSVFLPGAIFVAVMLVVNMIFMRAMVNIKV
jgi:tight adherence protein B